MSARLHVMLGEGGVGKTTLAAGYALALAARGHRVALLSIDPARRLQGALGLALDDRERRVPGAGDLHAALLAPEATLRRWATEGLADEAARERLLRNRLFTVLADRLATTTDVIAAVRLVEWLEHDPSLTDVVVDTAPGRNGIEFLQRPAALVALLQGRLVRWLRRFGGGAGHGPGEGDEPRGASTRVLRGLSHLGGIEMLVQLAQLVAAVERPFHQVLARLERAQSWLREPTTQILLVTTVREDAITATSVLRAALVEVGLAPAAVVVNRALPETLGPELVAVDDASLDAESACVVRYARGYLDVQAHVIARAASLAPSVVSLPARSGLDGEQRLGALAELGTDLCRALAHLQTP